jgi:hypothetical protein
LKALKYMVLTLIVISTSQDTNLSRQQTVDKLIIDERERDFKICVQSAKMFAAPPPPALRCGPTHKIRSGTSNLAREWSSLSWVLFPF